MIVIRINSGEARNRLQAIAAVIEHPADMLAESAIRVERSLRGHFAERDKRGNRLGGRRTHFWAAIANSTTVAEVTDQQASVEIGDRRFAQKLHGGTIRAKTPWPFLGYLLLTIPAHPQAHGRRASVLKRELGITLTFVGSARGGILAHFPEHRGLLSAAEAEGITYYVCVPDVTQAADPQALPPGNILEEEAIKGAEDYLRTEVQLAQSNPTTTTT